MGINHYYCCYFSMRPRGAIRIILYQILYAVKFCCTYSRSGALDQISVHIHIMYIHTSACTSFCHHTHSNLPFVVMPQNPSRFRLLSVHFFATQKETNSCMQPAAAAGTDSFVSATLPPRNRFPFFDFRHFLIFHHGREPPPPTSITHYLILLIM